MKRNETIAAIASAPGIGAIAVVRISGSRSCEVGDSVLKKPISQQQANKITINEIIDSEGNIVDVVLAVLFKSPNSYTSEDMVEIYCHGGHYIPFKVLDLIVASGAKMAEPGEFTLRAVLNNKMDLIQAEAVLDLVQAKSGAVASISIRNLSGELTETIGEFAQSISDILVQVEGNIDFPEDEEWASIEEIKELIRATKAKLTELIDDGRDGVMIREGPIVVLAGRKNVGKSTLFNRLLGVERAIVTPIPGTTRDYLMEDLSIGQHFIRLVDTAGLGITSELVEGEGIKRTKGLVGEADLLILILDQSEPLTEEDRRHLKTTQKKRRIVTLNKSDLEKRIDFSEGLAISAKTGAGIDQLKDEIKERIFKIEPNCRLILRQRQLNTLLEAKKYVESAIKQDYLETISSDLRTALDCFGTLTGKITNQDILNKIFAEFCIGK